MGETAFSRPRLTECAAVAPGEHGDQHARRPRGRPRFGDGMFERVDRDTM